MDRVKFAALLLVCLFPLSAMGSGGDLNMDGYVDGLDLGILLGVWEDPEYVLNPDLYTYIGAPDYNSDGIVDGSDLGFLLGQWETDERLGAASAVPEPTTATLLLTCCVLPAVVRRRR